MWHCVWTRDLYDASTQKQRSNDSSEWIKEDVGGTDQTRMLGEESCVTTCNLPFDRQKNPQKHMLHEESCKKNQLLFNVSYFVFLFQSLRPFFQSISHLFLIICQSFYSCAKAASKSHCEMLCYGKIAAAIRNKCYHEKPPWTLVLSHPSKKQSLGFT